MGTATEKNVSIARTRGHSDGISLLACDLAAQNYTA